MITVMLGSKTIQQLDLTKGRFLIGRNTEADICLDNVMISRSHAAIYQSEGRWVIEDLTSRKGVYINGKLVKKSVLNDRDIVAVGKYMLTFEQSSDDLERELAIAGNEPGAQFKSSIEQMVGYVAGHPPVSKRSTADVDVDEETMAISTGQLKIIRDEMTKRSRSHFVALTPMDRSVYPLDKRRVSIGRGAEADIRLSGGLTIGKVHATVTEEEQSYILEHSSGIAAIKLNGKRWSKSKHYLKDGDIVEIGAHKLKFVAGVADPKEWGR